MLPSGAFRNVEGISIADDPRQITLVETLAFAVPLWMDEIRNLTDDQRIARARRCGAMVAERGDVLMFGGKAGKAAEVFNALAEGIAAAAYQPGGITFAGRHWCTDHRQCLDAAAYAEAHVDDPLEAPPLAQPSVVDVQLTGAAREAL
jgi:hypothetical protein